MKEELKQTIITNTENFDELERLYRADKDGFRSAIKELHEEDAANKTAAIWYSRLFYKEQKEKTKNVDLLKDIGIICFVAFSSIVIERVIERLISESITEQKIINMPKTSMTIQ